MRAVVGGVEGGVALDEDVEAGDVVGLESGEAEVDIG